MSWAATRVTTRPEDMAYCLLGLFDISMPLIYGEGPKAFRRLQQAIIAQSNDLTILAWEWGDADGLCEADHGRGLFAPSPACFRGSAQVIPSKQEYLEFTNTNKGLLIRGDMRLGVIKRETGSNISNPYGFCVGWRGHPVEYQIGLRRVTPNMFCRDHTTFYEMEKDVKIDRLSFFYVEEFYILEENLVAPSVRALIPFHRRQSVHIPATEGFIMRD